MLCKTIMLRKVSGKIETIDHILLDPVSIQQTNVDNPSEGLTSVPTSDKVMWFLRDKKSNSGHTQLSLNYCGSLYSCSELKG